MKSLKIKNLTIGEGSPKICSSITEITKEDIIAEALNLKELPVDLVEWRSDWFENVFELPKIIELLKYLRNIFIEKPILFAFRRKNEGGEKEANIEEYKQLNIAVVNSKLVDLIDVEVSVGDEVFEEIVGEAHSYGVKVIASYHDYLKTPTKEELILRLKKMQALGADISKIAVMPNNKADVLTLLSATEEMDRLYSTGPIVTISMSNLGAISRFSGEVFGSALTFGALKRSSAPGQIKIEKLKKTLDLIHDII